MAGGTSAAHSRGSNGEQSRQISNTSQGSTQSNERSGASLKEPSDTPNFHQPPEWERRCRDLWRQGAQVVRKPDGSVNDWDVINWLLTRKGGANAVWPELEEGQRAIQAMRKETLDLNRIKAEIIEEWEERQRKEERRQHNKWLYRPRREWEQDRKRRQQEAAAKAQAIAKAEAEQQNPEKGAGDRI